MISPASCACGVLAHYSAVHLIGWAAMSRPTTLTAASATAAAAAISGSCAFSLVSSRPSTGGGEALRGSVRTEHPAAAEETNGSSSIGVGILAFATATAAGTASGRRRAAAVARGAAGTPREGNTATAVGASSIAMPFMAVPEELTNDPLNLAFPGDYGFDPLNFSSSKSSPLQEIDKYLADVCDNFGFPAFDKMRWYREAEFMHGRVAMLASFNLIVRETGDMFGLLPDRLLERGAIGQFASVMAVLELYRGYRLLFNTDALAGDLGLGMGPGDLMARNMTPEELAAKQLRELQNGRLAMVGVVGMAVVYSSTGHILIQSDQVQQLQDSIGAVMLPQGDPLWNVALAVVGLVLAADGARRLSSPKQTTQTNSIAKSALNLFKLAYGMQDPQVPLPAGVAVASVPQQLTLTEEQIVQFEEDGVIMIKGGMKGWVQYLSDVTDHQIENPHVWSLVGRMSGLYDYIQRNMWMTNDGFRNFLYYSPLGHVLSQLGRSPEVRVSTDMLLVNPNKGFGWHQDNQNGPIDFPDAIRWWVAMDRCGQNDYGAPEYLLGSHRNESVSKDAVFVNLKDGDLDTFQRTAKFVAEPGDLIVWDARTIHRIVAPPEQAWEEGTKRRAFGGTAAKSGAIYLNKGGASAISDLAGHSQVSGELLGGPYFPRIYPTRVPEEEALRNRGGIEGRSFTKMKDLAVSLASNAGKYISFTKVVGKKK